MVYVTAAAYLEFTVSWLYQFLVLYSHVVLLIMVRKSTKSTSNIASKKPCWGTDLQMKLKVIKDLKV